ASDWSSDVCSSDLAAAGFLDGRLSLLRMGPDHEPTPGPSQEGSDSGWRVPLQGGVRGGSIGGRFLTSFGTDAGAPRFMARVGVRPPAQIQSHSADQAGVSVGFRRVTDQAGWFVDHEQLGVFVN